MFWRGVAELVMLLTALGAAARLCRLQLTILRPPLAATVDQQVCDLASLAAIRALAEEWLASGAPLDLLVNK